MSNGYTTTALGLAGGAIDVLVNSQEGTARMPVAQLAAQLAAEVPGPMYELYGEMKYDQAWLIGSRCIVWGDPNERLRGVWKKTGWDGVTNAFVRISDLPMTGLATTLLNSKVDRTELDHRPGHAPQAWRLNASGKPTFGADMLSSPACTIQSVSGLGTVAVVTDADVTLSPRSVTPVYPGRVYRIDAYIKRLRNPVDPVSDVVRIGLNALDYSYTPWQLITVKDMALRALDGLWHVTATAAISTAIGEPDHVLPPNTVYLAPYARCFGSDHQTAIVQIEVTDITAAAMLGALDAATLATAVAVATSATQAVSADRMAVAEDLAAADSARAAVQDLFGQFWGMTDVLKMFDAMSDLLATAAPPALGSRLIALTGEVLEVVAPGAGDYNHPVTGVGLKVIPTGGKKLLTAYGGVDGADGTNALNRMMASVEAGDHLVINCDVTFSGAIGWDVTKDDVTIEWCGTGHIHAPNIDNAASSYLFRVTGQQLSDLQWDDGHVLDAGEWYVRVIDNSAVQFDDLIGIRTDIFFNGTGENGFEYIYNQDWLRVRSTTAGAILTTNSVWFSAPAANITQIEHWRPIRRTRIINPRLTGPGGGIAAGTPNGAGAKGFLCKATVDLEIIGGNMVGWPGYCVQIARYDNARVQGLVMDSGEQSKTSQAYYGVVHEGGRGGLVSGCIGRNIRRVADTGGGGQLLAIDIHHENIRGELCNGSAAGTHHAKNYTFRNITSVSSAGSAVVIRSRDNYGVGLTSLNDAGQALMVGPGFTVDDEAVGAGTTRIHGIRARGGYDTAATRGAAVRADMNGIYDLEGDFEGHTNIGLDVRGYYIDGFKFCGRVFGGAGCQQNVRFSGQKRLSNIDIQRSEFGGARSADIRVAGASSPENPARNITICSNILGSTVDYPIVINRESDGDSGWIDGASTRITDNIGTSGSGRIVLAIGAEEKWTCAPHVERNRKVRAEVDYSAFDRGVKIAAGMYDSLATIPIGTTFLDGDTIEISNPSAGAYPQYECVFAGTVGSLSGVSGSIAAGSAVLTLTGNTGQIGAGSIITVAGSGTSVYRVKSITADLVTATLGAPAANTVSNAAVSYRNPTFKGRGLLEL